MFQRIPSWTTFFSDREWRKKRPARRRISKHHQARFEQLEDRRLLAVTGDYDWSGVVDADDYSVWKSEFGSTESSADGNGDSVVNLADYTIWRDNLGAAAQAGDIEDHVMLSNGVLTICGTLEADIVTVDETSVTIDGIGTLSIDVASANSIKIHVYAGDDQVFIDPAVTVPASIFGREGDDLLEGGSGDDLIDGGDGDDTILGGDGNDSLHGGSGNDRLFGDFGNDELFGDDGDDILRGGYDDDFLTGGLGTDDVSGEIGDDEYLVNPGEDYLDDFYFDLDQPLFVTDASNNTNQAPQLEPLAVEQVDAGTEVSIQLDATDADVGQSLTYHSLDALPSGANLTVGGLFTWTPTDDQAGRVYEIRIAVRDNGTPQLQDTAVLTISVDRTLPDLPARPVINSTTETAVTLSWEASPSVDGYRIYRRRNGDWTEVGDVSGLSFTNTGLDRGTRYEYAVAAYNSTGESSPSLSTYATTVLAAPTNFAYTIIPGTSLQNPPDVDLTWNHAAGAGPSGNRIRLRIERIVNPASGWDEVVDQTGSTTTFRHYDQNRSSTSFYRIAAYTADVTTYSDPIVVEIPGELGYSPFQERIANWDILSAPTSVSMITGTAVRWHNLQNVGVTLQEAFTGYSIINDGLEFDAGAEFDVVFTANPLTQNPIVNVDGNELVIFALEYLLPPMSDPEGDPVWNHANISIRAGDYFQGPGFPTPPPPQIRWGDDYKPVDGWEIVGDGLNPDGSLRYWHGGFGTATGHNDAGPTPTGCPYDLRIVAIPIDLSYFGINHPQETSNNTSIDRLRIRVDQRSIILGVGILAEAERFAIDLKVPGILDDDEGSNSDLLIPVNAGYEEGNFDAQGIPVTDNKPDSSLGHRIAGAADPDLQPFQLWFMSDYRVEGTWTLDYDDDYVKVWFDDNGTFIEISPDQPVPHTIDGVDAVDLFFEGIGSTGSLSKREITAKFTPTDLEVEAEEDAVRFRVIEVDLDVDANNDDVINASDDGIEDIAGVDTKPGKIIVVNDADIDQDSLPDYLDGFGYVSHADGAVSPGVNFVPLVLNVSQYLADPVIEIIYSASSPTQIRSTIEQPIILPEGALRIWLKDGDVARNPADVADGGDFVAPGRYSLAQLGLDGQQTVTLYVEAIYESVTVGDQVVEVSMIDRESGLVVKDQVRFTATRFEIERRNLDGNWEPTGGFVASTLASGVPADLDQAWTTYRVNIYDPRQTGIATVDIEGQSLPLVNVGDRYQTPEFHAITATSAIPQGVPSIVITGEDMDWEYNPRGNSKFSQHVVLNKWDAEIAQEIIDAIDQIEVDVNNGTFVPNFSDKGWFGKEVDRRVRDTLRGRDGWLVDIIVDKDQKIITQVNVEGSTQVDVMRVKPGYNPQVGETLDPTQIEDVYEIKTSVYGEVPPKQAAKLKAVLNGGDPNGPRELKTALASKRYSPKTQSFIPNPRYANAIRILSILGVAAGSLQTAHAVWTFDTHDPEFEELINETRRLRREPGTPIEKGSSWITGPLQSYLGTRFGNEAAAAMVRVLEAKYIIDELNEIEREN